MIYSKKFKDRMNQWKIGSNRGALFGARAQDVCRTLELKLPRRILEPGTSRPATVGALLAVLFGMKMTNSALNLLGLFGVGPDLDRQKPFFTFEQAYRALKAFY